MKKYLLASIAGLSLISNLYGIDNWNDSKKHSYGRNNISVKLFPGLSQTEIKESSGTSKIKAFKKFGIGLHSKAAIKEIHYKEGEFFWEGTVNYQIYNYYPGGGSSKSDINDLYVDLGTGYNTNIGNIILEGSGGIGYIHRSEQVDQTTSTVLTTTTPTTKYETKGPLIYGEIGVGLDYRKWSIGAIGRVSYLDFDINGQSNKALKTDIKIPIQKNVDQNTAVIYTPSISKIKSSNGNYEETEIKMIITFSWIYN